MPLTEATVSQDTTVLALAGDGLTLLPGWAAALIALAFAAVMVFLLLLLVEMRRMSSAWTRFLSSAEERSRPLVEHANAAARNVEHITKVARTDIDRVNKAFTGLADGIAEAGEELQKRLRDVMALLDLAQSEAEDTVLEGASRLRSLRAGLAALGWPGNRSARASQPGDAPEAEAAPQDGAAESLPPRPPSGEAAETDRPSPAE